VLVGYVLSAQAGARACVRCAELAAMSCLARAPPALQCSSWQAVPTATPQRPSRRPSSASPRRLDTAPPHRLTTLHAKAAFCILPNRCLDSRLHVRCILAFFHLHSATTNTSIDNTRSAPPFRVPIPTRPDTTAHLSSYVSMSLACPLRL
jgi:hypothetical protein